MRCLVTGASGFLGSWLVSQLLREGDEVLALTRMQSVPSRLAANASRIRFTHADLRSIGEIAEDLNDFAPEIVFHLAWWGGNSSKYAKDPAQIYTNVEGSLELIRLAQGAGCSNFLFCGSSVEYGNYRVPVRETDPAEPKNLYGTAKLATLQLTQALAAQWGMKYCAIRPFWTYGPGDDELRMIPYVIRELLSGHKPKVTAGDQMWDFLYVEDTVRAITQLAKAPQATGIFNLGSGKPRRMREVLVAIRDLVNPALEIGFGEVPYGPDQIMHLQADIARVQSATGWAPQITLEEGLRRTVDWYRNTPVT